MRLGVCLSRCVVTACVCVLSACATEETVTVQKPFFSGLPGAESQGKPVKAASASAGEEAVLATPEFSWDEPLDPTKVSDPLVVVNADGSKTLVIGSIRHVMTHIERRLDEGDEGAQLLLDQVIAKATKEEFEHDGKSPEQIIEYLREHQRDIAVLFSRLPFAEHTPGVFLDKQGRNRFVLKLPPLAQKGSNFTELWVQMEMGTWKFLWAK